LPFFFGTSVLTDQNMGSIFGVTTPGTEVVRLCATEFQYDANGTEAAQIFIDPMLPQGVDLFHSSVNYEPVDLSGHCCSDLLFFVQY
jgi:hypothetical protein